MDRRVLKFLIIKVLIHLSLTLLPVLVTSTSLAAETFITTLLPLFRLSQALFHLKAWREPAAFNINANRRARITSRSIHRQTFRITLRIRHHLVRWVGLITIRRLRSLSEAPARDQPWKKSMDPTMFAWAEERWQKSFSKCKSLRTSSLLITRNHRRFLHSPTSILRWTTWHLQTNFRRRSIQPPQTRRLMPSQWRNNLSTSIIYQTHQLLCHQRQAISLQDLEKVSLEISQKPSNLHTKFSSS